MPVKAGYLLLAAGGGIFVYSGLKNKSVSSVFRQLAGGDSPTGATAAGQDVAGVTPPTTVSGAAATAMTGTSPGGSPGQAGSTVAQYQAYAFSQFAKYGWGADQEQPLVNLWNQESGWNASAANPDSDARGIAQNINGWSADYPENNPTAQILWGLAYIASRYGTPAAAWQHEQEYDWY